jgi:hypothetical protein
VFQTFEGDVPIAAIMQGPVVVARPSNSGRARFAVVGFDPLGSEMRFQVATPLLFANLLRWLAPETFDAVEFSAARVGPAAVSLENSGSPDQLRIRTESGAAMPFSLRNRALQLFAVRPEIISIESPGRQRILSLTLPDVADNQWMPPRNAASGLPNPVDWQSSSVTLWQMLAILAAGGLIAEWLLFGRRRRARLAGHATTPRPAMPAQLGERELVNR